MAALMPPWWPGERDSHERAARGFVPRGCRRTWVAGIPAFGAGGSLRGRALPARRPRSRLRAMVRQPIRVVLVDDHPAILDAVGSAVRASPDLELAASARSLEEATPLVSGPRRIA